MSELWFGSSSQEQEVVEKIKRLVDEEFEGDYQKAFTFYAGETGRIDKGQMTALFIDAEIGGRLTRWLYIKGAMEALDLNKDGGVSYEEFEQKTKQQ